MIDALGLEVAAIRKKGGGTQIELRGGERVGKTEGSWLYRFIVAEDVNLRDDTPVRVTCSQQEVSGVLVSFRDGVLIVALEKDMGPKIPVARLIANDSFLVERLTERLQKICSGEVHLNRQAGQRVLGLSPVRTADAEPKPEVLRGDPPPNDYQVLAVRRSLGSDTTYVWGPPGTGKTTTLARIVEAHYRAGRSVLLVSNTNIAVDTALEKVAERLKGEPEFHQGLVIRQGPVTKRELEQQFGRQVSLGQIVARLGESLHDEKGQLTREAEPLEAEERSLSVALRDLEWLARARRGLADRAQTLAATRSKVSSREREAREHRARAATLRADLDRARAMGSVRRFFSGLNQERLAREMGAASRAALTAEDAARALAADLPKHEADIGTLAGHIDRLTATTRAYPPGPEVQSRLAAAQTRLGSIRERIAAIDGEVAALEQENLAHCRILATTVYRTYVGKDASRQFDVVVIDEASMLMPPLVYYAACLATQAVTVAGDFRQLPPIVMCDEPLAAEWLKRDVFEKAGIPERLRRREPTPPLVQLRTQYRMREPICEVINHLFYDDNRLRSDPSVAGGEQGFPLGPSPLLYVDTSPFHPWTALRVGTYSRYNLFHALLVRNIVVHLAETGYLPAAGPNDAVGAIAPYASQARLIQALLDDRLHSLAVGIAATVHRFQGNEKKAMVLDLTDSLGARLGRFLKATRREDDGARLLNVAVSRARHHVVLLGNFEYLRAKAPSDAIVRRLIDDFEEHGDEVDLNALLPLAERDWVDGLHRVMPASFDFPEGAAGAFTEGTFYPAFQQDLARVRQSVVIFSPFATGPGTGRWVDLLRSAMARGVRVRVLMRPPEEPGGGTTGEVGELVCALRDLGVAVDLRARMHEKIAILDERILWHGSLNILSHRDTHESMLRIESPEACRQLARFVSTPAGHRDDAPALDTRENPECPNCGGPTVWNDGRFGIYFKCESPDCDGKVDARHRGPGHAAGGSGRGTRRGETSRRPSVSTATSGGRPCPTPGCGGQLTERNGRHGRFLGCTNYPRCRHTENLA
ncbi:MAG: AAA domain-containing protein [Thermoanaerobaculales bacterium]